MARYQLALASAVRKDLAAASLRSRADLSLCLDTLRPSESLLLLLLEVDEARLHAACEVFALALLATCKAVRDVI